MPLDDAVLQVEVRRLPNTARPVRLTVHRDALTLEGDFGTSRARLTFGQSRDMRQFIGIPDLGDVITRYGNPKAIAGVVAELSIPSRSGKIILCWDHYPEDSNVRSAYQRAKVCVKYVANVAKDLVWDVSAANQYARMLYRALNSSQPVPR